MGNVSKVAYSDLKGAWHLRKVEALRHGFRIVPPHVELIISDLCNHDCHFCAYRMSAGFSTELFKTAETKNPNRKIPTEKCYEILTDCARAGVKAIQFTGGGEPTVHPDFVPIVRYAQDLGLETSLVTNGYRLPDGWEDVFSRLSWLRVSLDAGDSETYSRVRGLNSEAFARTIQNIGRMGAVVKGRNPGCVFGVGYVMTLENHDGLDAACQAAHAAGAQYVRLAAMYSKDGASYYGDMTDEIAQKCFAATAKWDGIDGFEVVNRFDERILDLRRHAPDYEFCGYQHFTVYIGGDLNVYRCCTTAYTKHGLLGSLKDRSFADFLADPRVSESYFGFDARSCHTCQFNGQNRALGYLVSPDPVHVNFV